MGPKGLLAGEVGYRRCHGFSSREGGAIEDTMGLLLGEGR